MSSGRAPHTREAETLQVLVGEHVLNTGQLGHRTTTVVQARQSLAIPDPEFRAAAGVG